MEVRHCDQVARLPVVIVSGGGPPLLGRNWLRDLKLDWKNIFSLSETVQNNLSNILQNNIFCDHQKVKYCEQRWPRLF